MVRGKPASLEPLIPHIRSVTQCTHALQELATLWRVVESTAKMACPQQAQRVLPMLASTRQHFHSLQTSLLESMATESVAHVHQRLTTLAHHTLDTLVRNLYERTADIGFLATDASLRAMAASQPNAPTASATAQRLQAYRSKYTVYDDVLLLSPDGDVLASARQRVHSASSQAPWMAHALQQRTYIETFESGDLQGDPYPALRYSQQVTHPKTGEPCAVLCLSFDFAGEMAGIFAASGAHTGAVIVLLLDVRRQVIASSQPAWIGLGQTIVAPASTNDTPDALWLHAGRAYLASAVQAQPYQGYAGPLGWQCIAMTPLDLAFSQPPSRYVEQMPAELAQGLLAHAQTFCPPLHHISLTADAIRREVWNGQVMSAEPSPSDAQHANSQLQAVLDQVGEIGAQTNCAVQHAFGMLYDTALAASLHSNQSLTQLLVDVLERNLYERANDCRWWALTPVLRQLLHAHAQSQPHTGLLQQANQVLRHINQLYTVYTRLMVYDRAGCILCDSQETGDEPHTIVGQHIPSATLQHVLHLRDPQAYYACPWGADHIGTAQPTFIFHAPIRGDATGQVLGGIAIVLNGPQELSAMLHGALAALPHTQALFCNRQGLVLASSDSAIPAGSHVQLPIPQLLQMPPASTQAHIHTFQGQYCTLGGSSSRGYREFSTHHAYGEDVFAISYTAFGHVQPHNSLQQPATITTASAQHRADDIEVATFLLGQQLFGLRAQHVQIALPASAIGRVSAGQIAGCIGTLPVHGNSGSGGSSDTSYVWVFDLPWLWSGQRSTITGRSQVVVVQLHHRPIGLLVHALDGVFRFGADCFVASPSLAGLASDPSHAWVQEWVKANQGELLLPCLHLPALYTRLLGAQVMQAHPANSGAL